MGQGIDLLGAILRIFPERPPPAVDGSRLRTLLIVKLSSIGDVVHALPVASALRRTYPALRLTWAVEEWTAPLVMGHRAIDRLIVFPTLTRWRTDPLGWVTATRQAVRELRSETYDVAIDLQGLARSAAISRASRAPLRIARAGQREGAHLVSFGTHLANTRLHAVDEYLQVARHLGAVIDNVRFDLPVQPDAIESIARVLARHRLDGEEPLVVINPSASQRWKQWSSSCWVEVIRAIADSARVAVIGSAAHQATHAAIVEATGLPLIDLTGRTSLAEVVAILARAALHIAPDTGTVHIAAALGTPVVAVYGPTRPCRVGPFGSGHSVLYHGERCGRECPAYCIRGRRCLDAVLPKDVIARARSILSRIYDRMSATSAGSYADAAL